MKLHILNDLHIEFCDINIPKLDSDMVILAGDIHVGKKGLGWINRNFKNKEVIYVLGNHEYYYGIIPELCNDLIKKANGTNVHLLENSELVVDDVVFLGCTLWTNFELYGHAKLAMKHAKSNMNDFKVIKTMPGYKIFNPSEAVTFHANSFAWLSKKVKEYKDKKIVVVTHNAPSIKSCLVEYKYDVLTAAFVVDLEDFIKDSDIKVWIHGHTHNSSDYMIGDTRVICNSRGYCRDFGANENPDFEDCLVIEV